ncbi:hypothetical protein [Streptomyces sp. SID1121]|uniref:hypothetical protein n=1 Tax=Streptomyces sp. SID1121 TaxID=3425888 RepID=UPI0040570FC6
MKTCCRFDRIRSGFQQDIDFMSSYVERHPGAAPAKGTAKHVFTVKRNMARALSRHYERCRECG